MEFPIFFTRLAGWAQALVVAAAVTLVLGVIRTLVTRRLRTLAGRTTNTVDDLVYDVAARTASWFPFVVGVAAGAPFLDLPVRAIQFLTVGIAVAVALQVGRWLSTLVVALGLRSLGPDRDPRSGTVTIVRVAGQTVVWAIVVLTLLGNLGVNVTGLVAGLGVGGVAVALALQNVLSDLFASMAIAIDKPFEVGHFIVVDDLAGTVEQIGLKTTRVRSLSGEQLVFSNTNLLNARIRNYRRMEERRIAFEFGVTYQTSIEVLRQLPDVVRRIIVDEPAARIDRVHFKSYGDFALIFEVVYYVLDRDYAKYMDTQQRINLAMFEEFAALGAEFAYPTQTLFHIGPIPAPS